jgi:hypothetical protein
MKLLKWPLALALAISSTAMFAQDARSIDPCHAKPTEGRAAKNFLTFDQFDKELRVAITRQDAVALAFLVTFPLRVNDAGGTISLDDAAALKTHFQEVFTPAIRKEILGQKTEDLGCSVEGVMYGRGVIWVNASERGYSIWVVNRDSGLTQPANRWDALKIDYVCQTQMHRVVVDTVAGGVLRYRSWNKPRSVTGAPDLELKKGDGSFEGTDLCAVPIYTFKNGSATYKVEGGLGCYADSDGIPKGATGRLEVTVADKPPTDLWCY